MDDLFNKLITQVKTYVKNETDIEFITKAYYYAKEKHEGVFRKDGLPYISHPLEVTMILSDLTVGPNTLVSGLLHDVVEDTDTTTEEIKKEFNEDVSILVDGVTKVSRMKFASLEKQQVDNHQKMLLAMGEDIRVIIVKLADRLHNMRTMDAMPPEKRAIKSRETLEIYAPLAHKLGMFRIKNELEDKSLKYIEPDIYNKIHSLTSGDANFNNSVESMIENITNYFNSSNMKDFKIKGRVKNSYSIFKKMTSQNKEFEDIYDVLAIRVIVNEVGDCYQALGLVHAHFTPVPKRFKDYIAVPKQNMYQSLHTTVIGVNGQTFEIQIRTEDMDRVAEYGIAAHWGYKENVQYSKEKEQFEIAKKLKWYAELLQLTNENSNSEEFVQSVKGDILDANIYVYTPKGEVIALSKGATPLDLAYKIHTDLGHKTTGAIVNNKIVSLTYEMQNGDLILLKTSNNSKPSESWLKIVKTNYAKNKIRNFLNKQNKDNLIIQGKVELDRELNSSQRTRETLTDAFVEKHFGRNHIKSIEELYFEIGKGVLSVKTVENKLAGNT
ncbi:MAG: RelA/SpoT family protein, partial [bacterium]